MPQKITPESNRLQTPQSHWRFSKPEEKEGIVVFIDKQLEDCLPWWWHYYQLRNSYPVTFIDFGMSKKGLDFCKKRGRVLEFNLDPNYFEIAKSSLDPSVQNIWEDAYGSYVWKCRSKWMLKPFALQSTPYQTSIFLDIDTQILVSLSYLFDHFSSFSCAQEPDEIQEKFNRLFQTNCTYYNSGVMVYSHRCKTVNLFAETTLEWHQNFAADQDVLSSIIGSSKLPFARLPGRYNHLVFGWIPSDACILHWVNSLGKNTIREMSSILFYEKDPFA